MYYDEVKRKIIDLNRMVVRCEIRTLGKVVDNFSCARYPEGFLVFINAKLLALRDEYITGDPYSVSKNLKSNFQMRRLNVTLNPIKSIDLKRILNY